jgi:uncharacterized protein (TIGR00730 family)
MVKRVAVYLGSRPGNREVFLNFAYKLGIYLASKKVEVIYGGASVGTMGALAKGVKEGGGRIIGVFPQGFKGKKENSEKGIEVRDNTISEMIETDTLSSRIEKMNEMSDACIVLPGSFGTMNELFEYAIGLQLEMHKKAIHIINIDGFYDPLKDLISNIIDNGFMPSSDRDLLKFYDVSSSKYEK